MEDKYVVVVGVLAVIFTGLAIYLYTIDHRLRKLEKIVKQKQP